MFDEAGEMAVGEVLPSVAGPVGSMLVGGARVFREFRQGRAEDREVFTRGDVDDLLDLASVLRDAANDAERRITVVDAIFDLGRRRSAGAPIARASWNVECDGLPRAYRGGALPSRDEMTRV